MQILFLLAGFTVLLENFLTSLAAVRLNAAIQLFSLVGTPLAFYFVFYRTGVAASLLGSKVLATGLMACTCLPTTTNTGVMFTIQAKGDVALASVNAVLGNVAGTFSAPIMAALTIGGPVAKQDLKAVVFGLFKIIIAPLAVGLLAQVAARHKAPSLVTDSFVATVNKAASLLLVGILYLLFCKAFSSSADSIDSASVLRLCGVVAVVHTLILATAWFTAHHAPLGPMSQEQRVAFFLMAPQKTEAMGVAILTSIFQTSSENIGVLALPIVVYHTVQVLVAAALVSCLQQSVDERHSDDGNCDGELNGRRNVPSYQPVQTEDTSGHDEDDELGYGAVVDV
jgi:predicted Na+-dependent transporter